jgi:heme exporter protein C
MALVYAPREVVMGDVQRVFYFHVAAGWVGMLSFGVTAVAGGLHLATRAQRWDELALAAVELGIVFSLANIVSGSIWARPVWNTWWTWDPRLVTATVMVLIYLAYLMLRSGIEDPERRARIASLYGIAGFITVPLTFLSIRYVRTIHPVVIGGSDPSGQGAFDMTPRMLHALLFSVVAFTVVYAALLWHRVRLEHMARSLDAAKRLRHSS